MLWYYIICSASNHYCLSYLKYDHIFQNIADKFNSFRWFFFQISPTNNSGPPIVSSGALTELDLSDNGPGIADSPPMATTNTLARVPHPLAIRLRRNSLISLPKWLSRLSSLLQQLDLADNQFTSLPRALVNFER